MLVMATIKLLAYISSVRPKIAYPSSIWNPHHINLINILEEAQDKAGCFILSDYSHTSSVAALNDHSTPLT